MNPDRELLLEFGQWLTNERTRLSDLTDAIEEDEPDEYVALIDRFLGESR